MRRERDSAPFDFEADEERDLTEQFWGRSRRWSSHEVPVTDGDLGDTDPWRDDTTGSLRAIRDGFAALRPRVARRDATGQIERTRQHGIVRPHAVVESEATLAELGAGHPTTTLDWSDLDADGSDWPLASEAADWDVADRPVADDPRAHDRPSNGTLVPLEPNRRDSLADRLGIGAVDPLLLRVGILVLVAVLLVPLALALRSDDAGAVESNASLPVGSAAGAAPAGPPPVSVTLVALGATVPDAQVSTEAAAEQPATEPVTGADPPSVAPEVAAASGDADQQAEQATDPGDVAQDQAPSGGVSAATVSAAAERVVPECPLTYEAGPGDSWYRIADAAGVSAAAVLGENRATVDTPIFPGDEICLPDGAAVPTPPTTSTAPTTEAPATTAAPTTTSPTTTAPTTTAPNTTAPRSTPSEVEQIIRDVWPDELEDKALEVAWRESRYDARAYNGWCCYGVFQLYWTVHRGWLDDYGITTIEDLYDARKNVTAAYALYQRSGGWGPWGG